MDVHLVEFKSFLEKLLVDFFPLLGLIIFKLLGLGVYEDACNTFCRNVVFVDHLDLL